MLCRDVSCTFFTDTFTRSVGVDCQFFENGKFRQITTFRSDADGDRPVVPVLANLAVRRDKRKKVGCYYSVLFASFHSVITTIVVVAAAAA